MDALRTLKLSKSFGRRRALDRVSMAVPAGAIYGFLGANGAGKTTTIKLILGLLRPDAGGVHIARPGSIGALVEAPALYDHLTGRENLDLTRRLLGVRPREIDRVLEIVGLIEAQQYRAGGYSLGMRQRLGIARALIGRPALLILDEPVNGLDPDGIRDMRTLLRDLPGRDDVTLIVSSHLLSEIEQIGTHVGLLHRGRLLAEAPLADLLGESAAIEVETDDLAGAARLLVQAGFELQDEASPRLIVRGRDANLPDPADIARLLVRHGHHLSHLGRQTARLETIYRRHLDRAA